MSTQTVAPVEVANGLLAQIELNQTQNPPAASTTVKDDFPEGVQKILKRPLPKEALSPAPRGMTSIKSIYISERLNEAFGLGRWYTTSKIVERSASK
jgi:hypothetical protein